MPNRFGTNDSHPAFMPSNRQPSTMFRFLLLACPVILAGGAARVHGDDASEAVFRKQLAPLLRTYCFDCHDLGDEIALESDDSAASIAANRKTWLRALAQVRLGTMPPEDGDKMDSATRQRMADLIDKLANAVDCVQDPNAGKVVMRRLNRAEYRNTIRDLTGVDYQPAEGFPGDDVGYGFDNIGDVLSLPPLLMEKYLDAAEYITGKAIYTPPPPEIYEINRAPSSLIGAQKHSRGRQVTLASHGTVSLEPALPFAGQYTLTITASGDQGGDEPVKMEVKQGKTKRVFRVPSKNAKDYKLSFRLGRGKRKTTSNPTRVFFDLTTIASAT